MKPYKIFISHSHQNKSTAEAVLNILSDAFKGRIEFYLAVKEVQAGVLWKEELKRKLLEKDAIISLVTPDFINQPWFHIEWAPFWLSEKACFLLLTAGLTNDNLILPMRDRQVRNIDNKDEIANFFQALHTITESPGDAPRSYDQHVNQFLNETRNTLELELLSSYEKYRNGEKLPEDEGKIEKILTKFYNDGDLDTVKKLARGINNDRLEQKTALVALEKGNLSLCEIICESIKSSDLLYEIVYELINRNHLNASEFTGIIKKIETNDTLIRIVYNLVRIGHEGHPIFPYIVDKINDNSRDKIARVMIPAGQSGTPSFDYILKKMENAVHLSYVANELIEFKSYKSEQFKTIVLKLFQKNDKHVTRLLDSLQEIDPEYICLLYKSDFFASLPADSKIMKWLAEKAVNC